MKSRLKFEWYNRSKNRLRASTNLLFNNGAKINLTLIKNNSLLAPYNAADLSMLQDFDEIKINLSVVNKSFLTLGKPLKFKNTFVYIRDTILLAPSGKSSLAELGKLYETDGDYSKLKISYNDLNKMSAFLKRDPQAFQEYAIRDAVITLKHAIAMEKFNMSIKQIGIPVTLASIGRKYVKGE